MTRHPDRRVGILTVADVERPLTVPSARRVARIVFSAIWGSQVMGARVPVSALLTTGYHPSMEA